MEGLRIKMTRMIKIKSMVKVLKKIFGWQIPVVWLFIPLVGILTFYLSSSLFSFSINNANKEFAGDMIVKIKATEDIKVQSKFYLKLIEKIGPEKAQEEFYHSGLPFNGQTHLLNHTVGDYLYKKY